MNISQLDRIDNEERYQEIRDELDEFDNHSDGSGYGERLDVDLSYSEADCASENDSSSAKIRGGATPESREVESQRRQHQQQQNDGDGESYADMQELEKLKHMTNLTRSEDDSEVIHRLVQSLHQRNTDYRALELQFNHVKLQNESLLHQERKLRETVNSMEFDLAVSEENIALLEQQLKNVASFEDGYAAGGGGGGSKGSSGSDNKAARGHSLEKLRGTLLNASHRQIYDLEQELRQLRRLFDNDSHQYSEKLLQVQSQNQALREEAQALGERLAQRTVLYSAQERRFQTHQRVSSMDIEGKADELLRTSAKLQQMEGQCAQLDRERLQLMMLRKEHEITISAQRDELERDSKRVMELEEELTGALDVNRSLQDTISLLRGSDLEELERGMAQEVEAIRSEAKAAEDGLRRDLTEARDLLRSEHHKVGLLKDESEEHRRRLREVTDLLREVWGHSGLDTTGGGVGNRSSVSVTSKSSRVLPQETHSVVYDLLYGDQHQRGPHDSHQQEMSTLGQESAMQHMQQLANPMRSFISDSSVGSVSNSFLTGQLRPPAPSAAEPSASSTRGRLEGQVGGGEGDEELFSVASIFWKMKVNSSGRGLTGSFDSTNLSEIKSRKAMYEAGSSRGDVGHTMSSIESNDSFHLQHALAGAQGDHKRASDPPPSNVSNRYGSDGNEGNDDDDDDVVRHRSSDEEEEEEEEEGEQQESSSHKLKARLSSIDMQYIKVLSALLEDLIHSILYARRAGQGRRGSAKSLPARRGEGTCMSPSLLQKGICRFILGIKAPLSASVEKATKSTKSRDDVCGDNDRNCDEDGDNEDGDGDDGDIGDVLGEFDSLPLTRDEMLPVEALITAVGCFMEAVPESILRAAEERCSEQAVFRPEEGIHEEEMRASGGSNLIATSASGAGSVSVLDKGTDMLDFVALLVVETATDTCDFAPACTEMGSATDDLIVLCSVEVNTDDAAEVVDRGSGDMIEKADGSTQSDHATHSDVGTETANCLATSDVGVHTDERVEQLDCGTDTSDLSPVPVLVEAATEMDNIIVTAEHMDSGTDTSDMVDLTRDEQVEQLDCGTDTSDLSPVPVLVEAATEMDNIIVTAEHMDSGTDTSDMVDMTTGVSELPGCGTEKKDLEVSPPVLVERGTGDESVDVLPVVEVAIGTEDLDDLVTYEDDGIASMSSADSSGNNVGSDTGSSASEEYERESKSITVDEEEEEKAALRRHIEELQEEVASVSGLWQREMLREVEAVKNFANEEHVRVVEESATRLHVALTAVQEKTALIEELQVSLREAMDLTQHMTSELESSKDVIETERRLKVEAADQLESVTAESRQAVQDLSARLAAREEDFLLKNRDVEVMREQYESIFSKLRAEISTKEKELASTREQHDDAFDELKIEIQSLKSELHPPDDKRNSSLRQANELRKWKAKFYDETPEEEANSVLDMVMDIYNQKNQLESGFAKIYEEKIQLESQLTDRNESISAMKADIVQYAERMQGKWKESKHALKSKYKHKAEAMQAQHDEEMQELIARVKAECADICAEVKRAEDNYKLQTNQLREEYEAKLQTQKSISLQRSGTGSSSKRSSSGFTPEMLSPEETQELVRSILSRSAVTSISLLETPADSSSTHFSSSDSKKVKRDKKRNTQEEKPPLSPTRSHGSSSRTVRNSINMETRDMIIHALQGGSLSDLDISSDSMLAGESFDRDQGGGGDRDRDKDKYRGESVYSQEDAKSSSPLPDSVHPPVHAPPPLHPSVLAQSHPSSPPRSAVLQPAATSQSPLLHQHSHSARLSRRKQQDPHHTPHETEQDRGGEVHGAVHHVSPSSKSEGPTVIQKSSSQLITDKLEKMMGRF